MDSARRTDVLIVGAGPAGIAMAIQLKRYGIHFMLFEKERVGGLLWNANLVENYPGFPRGVSGPNLIDLFEKQMCRIGVEVVCENVVNVDRVEMVPVCGVSIVDCNNLGEFVAETSHALYRAKILVVASGTKPMPFPIPIPAEVRPHVFSDVTQLLDVTGKEIVIVGAGDAAFDHALNLGKRKNFVTILNRGRDVKCLPLLAERVKLRPEIQYEDEVTIQGLESDGTNGLIIRCQMRDSARQIRADNLIFAIGREPQREFLSANLRAKEGDLVSTGRLYFIGDVRNGLLRQTAIAVGDGLRAAMQIYLMPKDEII